MAEPFDSMPFPAPGAESESLAALLDRQLQLMDQQLRVTAQQLELLGRAGAVTDTMDVPVQEAPMADPPRSAASPPAAAEPLPVAAEPETTARTTEGRLKPAPFVAHQPAQVRRSSMSEVQERHLQGLVERLESKARGSKRLTQDYRRYLADNRTAIAFRLAMKELLYPIFVDHAQGSRVWDIDGNEYIDVTMGFGTLIFGHSPEFVVEALKRQSERGLGIGLEPPLSGPAARLICELTGNDRASFVNDGTEAVKSAVRLARTLTGRTKIAMFQGAYHGWFDDVMAISRRGGDGQLVTLPMAPGVSPHVAENVLVLDYCSPESIEILERRGHELAAVVVDPQQSRRPGAFDNTQSFLHDIRRVTSAAGAAMILDEVVTGFRIRPGGAQEFYDVRADLVAYGKAAGAGLPIGVVSGKAEYMDGIDGGHWSYGDSSYPLADQTFIQGSYFKHPLVTPAIFEVLRHFQESGPALQEELTGKMERLGHRIREHLEREGLPIEFLHWGSLANFIFGPEVKYPSVFFYHLLERGVYVRDARPWFVSTAHTERDLDELVEAVKASTAAMQAGGFLPRRGEAAERTGRVAARGGAVGETMASSGREPLPLTESQKALWIATQMGEDAARAYHMPIALRLAGPLPAVALAAAGQRMVDRHEALRTVFGADGEFQRFQPRIAFPVVEADLGGLPPARREGELARLVHALTQRPFDLERGPLLRCGLLRLGPAEQALVLVFHHLVVDGWSLGMVLGELDRALAAELSGESCQLPPVALFGDYVRRQHEPGRLESDEAYWLERFALPPPVFSPPTDRPRPPIETFAGGRALRTVDAGLTLAIRRLGGRRGCTLPATLLALFSALLHRLCGQLDLVVGMPAAGQAEEGGGALVGYCLQILPLRIRLAGPERLNEHLVATRRSLLDAHEHRAYPLTRLIHRLGVPRDPSRTPLVGALFNVDTAWSMSTFGGLRCELLEPPVETAQYELSLNVEDGSELRLGLDYKSDLFDHTTVQRWLGAFDTLCRCAVDNPEETVLALPLLSPAERHQLLAEWNDTAEPVRQDHGIPAQVAAQARRTPEAIAVAQDERQWSYGELDRRAARLARRLESRGIGAEDLVGLCLERTPELLVALLGVQKAGAAYLPLDPSFPAERLAHMLADSGARWVLTEESLSSYLAGYRGRILFLEGEAGEGDGRGEEAPGAGPGPDGRAYVLYTSGSTGRPKGVEVCRRSLLNFLASMARRPGLGPADLLVAVTTLSFDIAALELYLPLLVGGRLELASRETAADGDRLADLLARSGATVAQATPATWRLLLAAGWRNPSRLRVLCGGEALPRDLAEALLALGTPLWNLYGPTETTVWSAVERVGDGGAISLGRPIANTALRLLDRGLRPVPVGVTGEIYIGGVGVARGYLGQAAGTAERFLPDPLAERPGERLYRTGDLARWRPDGGLEFLDRADQQVKVRGLRIELEEIEAALGAPAWVAAAAVALREPRSGDQRLVGYVVLREDQPAPEDWGEALRAALRRRLPSYMVPSVLLRLPALPLTPNGKVDRRALPAPESLEVSAASMPGAGETASPTVFQDEPSGTEQAVAAIWREVLGTAAVGLDDNFFDLGGHSLLLIEVRQRLRPLAGRTIPLLELFRHPTIRSLAAFVAGSTVTGSRAGGEAERGRARQASQELQRATRQRRRAAKSLGQPEVDLGGADDGSW